MVDHVVEFDLFTEPMKSLLETFAASPGIKSESEDGVSAFVVSSAHPRMVNGKPSQNRRYLQPRPDLVNPRDRYLAEIAARLERDIPSDRPVYLPVNAVLCGRRNSPPDPNIGLPPLAVYGPIHYQELPELFMEFISSLTGKQASETLPSISLSFNRPSLFLMIFCSVFIVDILLTAFQRSLSNVRSS